MNKLKDKLLSIATPDTHSWVEENRAIIAQIEDGGVEDSAMNDRIILRLIGYMRTNGLTQRDLAAKLGVSPQYINKIIRGREGNIGVTTASRYGRLLKIDLFGREEVSALQSNVVTKMMNITQVVHFEPTIDLSTMVSYTKKYSLKAKSYATRPC